MATKKTVKKVEVTDEEVIETPEVEEGLPLEVSLARHEG